MVLTCHDGMEGTEHTNKDSGGHCDCLNDELALRAADHSFGWRASNYTFCVIGA